MKKPKIIRVSTVPISLATLLKGQLSFLSKNGYEVIGVSSPGPEMEEVVKHEGIRVETIKMERRIAPFKDIISLFRLIKLFRKEKPDIVHSITPKAGLLSMLAAKFTRVPVRIHTFTGLIFPTQKGFMQKLLIKMDQLLCRAATHIYPEGEGVKEDLINYKITNKKLDIIANGNVNGIDLEHFNPLLFSEEKQTELKQSLGIKEEDFVYVFVGRLVRDKGINELINTFSKISQKHPNIKLILVGNYEQKLDPLLPETIQKIKENKQIIETGFQPDVRPYFSVANALVFPSYREGFPNVVLQAGAMNLPSIVSDINGCNEIITEGVNGMIIPSQDSIALEQAMLKLYEDKTLYNSLQTNARSNITQRFDQHFVWQEILKEYAKIYKGPKLLRMTTIPMSFLTLLDGQLSYMSQAGFDMLGVTSPGKGLQEIEDQEQVRMLGVKMTRQITPFLDLVALCKLIFLFRREKPKIVHTHTPKAGLLGMLAAYITRVPYRMHTVTGLPLTVSKGLRRRLLGLTEKTTYACANHIYPNSFGLKDIIVDYGFAKEEKLKVIGNGSSNGIDPNYFDEELYSLEDRENIRKSLQLDKDDFVFIYVGRLVGDKGINELVKAFSQIKDKHAKLLLVGPLESDLDPLSKVTLAAIEQNNNIIAVDFQKDVRPFLVISDVLTFPSYREGFPNVVMQAAAMNLNCIVSNINGCNEIISDGDNGWIVPVKNIDILQNRMQWCLDHPQSSTTMGQKSRALMIEKYERSYIWEELLKEYKNVMNAEGS